MHQNAFCYHNMHLSAQNQCRARGVAAQQGHRVVAELLDAWERRQQDPSSPVSPDSDTSDTMLPKPRWKKPPLYTDIIPGPRHSPHRALSPGGFKNITSVKGKQVTNGATGNGTAGNETTERTVTNGDGDN